MSVTDISEKELRQFMESIMQLAKCIACKKPLTTPVKFCHGGHLVCSTCYIPKCPACDSVFLSAAMITVNTWVWRAPKECKFVGRGCKAIVLLKSAHLTRCPYSYICELCGALGHIVKHFRTKHPDTMKSSNIVTGSWNLKRTERHEIKYFLIDDSLFRVSLFRDEKCFTIGVYCLRSNRTDEEFVYTMEYKVGEVQFTYTGDVLDYKEKDNYAVDNQNFMRIPLSKVPALCLDGKLQFTIRIKQMEWP